MSNPGSIARSGSGYDRLGVIIRVVIGVHISLSSRIGMLHIKTCN